MRKIVCLLILVAGCGSNLAESPVGRPIQTAIPEGIYLGEITTRTRTFINGELFEDTTTTEPYQEIVDENGLPLIQPQGETPVQGLVITFDDGIVSSRLRVQSVNASGNRVFIAYTGTMTFEGLDFSASGTWTYEFFPPNQLDFIEQISLLSESVNGVILSMDISGTSVLTK